MTPEIPHLIELSFALTALLTAVGKGFVATVLVCAAVRGVYVWWRLREWE